MSEKSEYIFKRKWERGTARVLFHVDSEYRSFLHFEGKGSMEGTRAFVGFANEAIAEFGENYRSQSLVDLTKLHSAPLRAQFVLGKWLLKNKRYLTQIAVFGGKPFEMAIARAVMKIARMKSVGFFNRGPEARRFLNFSDEVGQSPDA